MFTDITREEHYVQLILLKHIFIVQIYIWDLAQVQKRGPSPYTNKSYNTIIDIHNIYIHTYM